MRALLEILLVSLLINVMGIAGLKRCEETTRDHSLGKKGANDKEIYFKHIERSHSADGVFAEHLRVSLPNKVITMIEIIDNKRDGHGGCADVEDGALGSSFAHILMKSDYYHGINFKVYIYGH